tara:strand:+ start:923 stop:1597 length:675 start_codon:yes stop_codon:yes gene_type:complete
MTQQRKSKKVLVYFFLLILFGSVNNISLNNIKFEGIKKINVSGLQDKENEIFLKNILDLNLENIFLLNKKEILELMNQNTLIDNYIVFKKYPSTLNIKINRTNFLAKINKDGKDYIIGSNGKLSNEKFSINELPYIFGKPEIEDFISFKKILDQSKIPYNQIRNLFFFPSKRWDIELKNNVILKLSRDNVEVSLENAFKVLNDKDFKDAKIIDVRLENKIITNG